MHFAYIRKQAHLIRVHDAEYILAVLFRRFPVLFIGAHIKHFGVTEAIEAEYDFFLLHLLLFNHDLAGILEGGLPGARVLLLHRLKLADQKLRHLIMIIEQLPVQVYLFQRFIMILHERVNLETDQFDKAHIQDRIRLSLSKHQLRRLLAAFLRFEADAFRLAEYQAVHCHFPVF